MFRPGLISITALLALLAGCSNYASFPPLEGGSPAAKSSNAPVPEVIATAIEWCVARENYKVQDKAIDFRLPKGMDELTYTAVVEQLEMDGITGAPKINDERGDIEVRSVRLFGLRAMVDLSIPGNEAPRQLISLELHSYPFQAWSVRSVNRWRFNESQLEQTHQELQQQASADAGS